MLDTFVRGRMGDVSTQVFSEFVVAVTSKITQPSVLQMPPDRGILVGVDCARPDPHDRGGSHTWH